MIVMQRVWLRVVVIALLLLSTSNFVWGEEPSLLFEWRQFDTGYLLQGLPWSPDNTSLAITSLDNAAVLLTNRTTWEVERQIALPTTEFPLTRLWWSPNGHYIAVANDFELIVLDTMAATSSQFTDRLPVIDGRWIDARWLGNSNVLAVLNNSGLIVLLDVVRQEISDEIELDGFLAGEAFYTAFDWNETRGLFAAPLYSSNTIGFWNESGAMPNGLVREMAPNENRFASPCGAWRPEGESSLEFDFSQLGGNVDVTDLQWSLDGTHLALVANYNVVICTINAERTDITAIYQRRIPDLLYDPNAPQADQTMPYSLTNKVAWSPDDRWLLVSLLPLPLEVPTNSCGLAVFDRMQDFSYTGMIGEQLCFVQDMSWSPDGNQLAVQAGTDGQYWLGTLQAE